LVLIELRCYVIQVELDVLGSFHDGLQYKTDTIGLFLSLTTSQDSRLEIQDGTEESISLLGLDRDFGIGMQAESNR